MSDSISSQVADQIQDIGKEGIKDATQTVNPKNLFKEIVNQITGGKKGDELTPEEKASKEVEQQTASRRIAEIDAEIARIAAERAKLTGPEIASNNNATNTNENLMQQQSNPNPQPNLQIIQAQTKGETGRGAKG